MPKIIDLPELTGLHGDETVVIEKGAQTGRASFNDYLDASPAVPSKRRPAGGPRHVFADKFGFFRAYVDAAGGFGSPGAAFGPGFGGAGIAGGFALRASRRTDFAQGAADRFGFLAEVRRIDGARQSGGISARTSRRADFVKASVDRAGFLADVVRASGERATAPGGVSSRRIARRDFLNAWVDRIGFLRDIKLKDGGTAGGTIPYAAMNARALGTAALRRNIDTLELAQPTADWNIVLSYGQSISTGWEGWPALTTTAATSPIGLYMLGDSDHPQGEDATSWVPFGTAQLNPLKATVWKAGALLNAAAQAALAPGDTALGETPGIAATIVARQMWLQQMSGIEGGGRRWIHAACGVGGRTIEQLSYGAAPHYFNRLIDYVTRIKALADAQGKTVRIVGFLFLQGEYNAVPGFGGATDRAANLAKRQQLRADVQQYVCSIIGQTARPAWIEYQVAGSYVSDAHGFGVQMAELDFLEQNRTSVFGSQPHFAVTDKGGHLDPNGYRWLGCMMGRALGTALTRGKAYWPLTPFEAVRHGREVVISHLVPAPPLQWKGVWRWTGAAQDKVVFANKGFALLDAAGAVPIASVRLLQDSLVQIVAARSLVGAVQARLGGAATYDGNHNLFDSDPAVMPLNYEYAAGTGQYPSADIAELVGKPYPAQSASYLYQIPVTPI
ncbi:hypothetical protein WG907_05185 [Sphingobium sp. AN558]|uniref:hypothetical protein n=1 Tax=Sphingobium sp. AN558 TaxID=3133442 RepID=UPI0030BE12F0